MEKKGVIKKYCCDDFNSEDRLKTLSNDPMKRYVAFGSYYPIIVTFSGYLTNGGMGSLLLNGREFLQCVN